MTILVARTVWRKPRAPRLTARPDELTPTEQANVRRAIRFLFLRFDRSWIKLATAMGLKKKTLWQAASRRTRKPTAGLALRAARIANVRAESILAGEWPTAQTPVRIKRSRLRSRVMVSS